MKYLAVANTLLESDRQLRQLQLVFSILYTYPIDTKLLYSPVERFLCHSLNGIIDYRRLQTTNPIPLSEAVAISPACVSKPRIHHPCPDDLLRRTLPHRRVLQKLLYLLWISHQRSSPKFLHTLQRQRLFISGYLLLAVEESASTSQLSRNTLGISHKSV